MWEAYRVRRKFQYMGWVYCPPGPCTCSTAVGSDLTSRVVTAEGKIEGKFDANPCESTDHCTGLVATNCSCGDAGYCGCSIKQYMYGGDIWLVREKDPRKEHMLMRRFSTYDPNLPSGNELDNMIGPSGNKHYTSLALGEPQVGLIVIDEMGKYLNGVASPDVSPSINKTEILDEQEKAEKSEENANPVISKFLADRRQ